MVEQTKETDLGNISMHDYCALQRKEKAKQRNLFTEKSDLPKPCAIGSSSSEGEFNC